MQTCGLLDFLGEFSHIACHIEEVLTEKEEVNKGEEVYLLVKCHVDVDASDEDIGELGNYVYFIPEPEGTVRHEWNGETNAFIELNQVNLCVVSPLFEDGLLQLVHVVDLVTFTAAFKVVLLVLLLLDLVLKEFLVVGLIEVLVLFGHLDHAREVVAEVNGEEEEDDHGNHAASESMVLYYILLTLS